MLSSLMKQWWSVNKFGGSEEQKKKIKKAVGASNTVVIHLDRERHSVGIK
jgi:hypothetical protein